MTVFRTPSESLLSQASLPQASLTPLQSQVDGLVDGFVEQATDWKSLAAMTAGGITYRLGRMGVMATGAGRLASLGIGLGAEVTAFEMTNRSLSSLTGVTHSNPNLWRWEGQGGIRQGLLSSLITFGSLKGAGRLAQGENGVVQHLLQDTGMVLGHQVSGAFGITPRPTGSLAEQFLHAEATNLQLSAGMALAHGVAPGIQGIERGLDLSLRSAEIPPTPLFQRGDFMEPALASASGGSPQTSDSSSPAEDLILEMKAAPELESVGSHVAVPAAEPTFTYPPEIESAWSHVEERFRDPGYYEGTREELAAKRPDPDAVDKIRSYQAEDYGRRIPGARVEILDAEALLDSSGNGRSTDKKTLQEALFSLGARGRLDSPARRLVRIYLPINVLSSLTEGKDGQDLSYLLFPPGVTETEKFLNKQVRLGVQGPKETRLDIVSLSLLEALYQTVLGQERAQFHYVPGTIPRDLVMSLRARRASPVGLARGLILLGDVNSEVHPFSFTAHDAEFHGGLDAVQPDPFPEIGGWLYSALARRLPPGDFREIMLDHLSDSNLGGENGSGLDSLSKAVLSPLQLFLSGRHSDLESVRLAKEEALGKIGAFTSLIVEEGPRQPHLTGREYFFLRPLEELSSHIRETQVIASDFHASELWPPPDYKIEMLRGWREIKTVLDQPDHLTGTREALRSRRPSEDLIDSLFHFQAEDYGYRLPDTQVYSHDMEVFFDDSPVINEVLASLGERGDVDSPARRVLEFEVPTEVFDDAVAREIFDPDKKYFPFILLHETEQLLQGAVQLIHREEGKIRFLIPSLSFMEKLFQAKFGAENAQFHYVHGTPDRDVVMRLRGRRVSLVGLSSVPIYLGDINGKTHPFNLTVHDAFFHGAHDASRTRFFPETFHRFYDLIKTRLDPTIPGFDYTLDRIADLENEIFDGHRLMPWGRYLMEFLELAFHQNMALTDLTQRRRQIGEIEALSSFLHRWVRNELPPPDRREEGDRLSLREFFELRRRIHEEFRRLFRIRA